MDWKALDPRTVMRFLLTLLLFGLVVWWLAVAYEYVNVGTTKDDLGNIVNPYDNAKTMLLVVLPLLTTALGYWFGEAGKEKAERGKQEAEGKATAAQAQLTALASVSTDSSILEKARAAYPGAFPKDLQPKPQ